MRVALTVIMLISICQFSCRKNPSANDVIQSDPIGRIIEETNLDSLSHFVNILSGELPVSINGMTYTIASRHKDYPGNNIAAEYILQKMRFYGLTAYDQVFSPTGRNVIGFQTGNEYPDQYYVICAHYDCYPNNNIAPGADDNASGTAAVIEAARLLSELSPQFSIVYALFDEEEQGLRGALHYANEARAANERIIGAINLDMIAWDSNDDGRFWINVRDTANSAHLSNRMVELHNEYNIGLSPQVLNPGYGSDNHAFWRRGYAAIGVEEMYGEDWNDHYHLVSDRIEHFNMPYFHKLSQLTIATLASLAGVEDE